MPRSSSRYSSSPALHVRIGRSRLRSIFYVLFSLLLIAALGQLYTAGYGLLILIAGPVAAVLLWNLQKETLEGYVLAWREGRWALAANGAQPQSVLVSRCITSPWVTYMALTSLAGDQRFHLWLFVDSMPGHHWRRLRVRLALQS